ncbi:MAG: GNAT family N-acetyltransferase [Pseudomonadota bacterium]
MTRRAAAADMVVQPGLPERLRAEAVALYWAAFEGKLRGALGTPDLARAFLERAIDPSHALAAISGGRLFGVVGFKTQDGSFVAGDFGDLRAVYGLFGAVWRGAALWPLERPVEPGRLLMDGICVDPEARGRGIGGRLLSAVEDEARRRGLDEVRLDVIDSNPRARALYERRGYRARVTRRFGPFGGLYGFRFATEMVKRVDGI